MAVGVDFNQGDADARQEPNVGRRIRSLRQRRGLSLRVLAERSGLSRNAISLIERGENSPTVSSLHLLSTALHVPITTFFEDERQQVTVIVRRDHRLRTEGDGYQMESLGIGLRDQRLAPFLVTVQPGAGNAATPVKHSGEEFVYCLEGEVDYQVGSESHRLTPGDSLLFEASQPHGVANRKSEPAIVILVFQMIDGSAPVGSHHLVGASDETSEELA
ncbi:MAG: XRE family transcriptional regulator [Anaerolineales bacterium]